MSQTSGPAGQFGARLHQIADALGITVSQLHGDDPPPLLRDALALLSAYVAITDAQGRQRVLSVAQHEAERCRRTNEATGQIPPTRNRRDVSRREDGAS